jgi:acyl-CoA synthetase (AMP-forming)/AMP-acid ligase II
MRSIGDLLVLNANRYPENTAIVHRGQRFTYREVNERVNRLCHHLLDLGVRKGDRIGIMLYNSNQFVEIFFAAVKIGAIAVPLNFRMIPREIKWALDHMACKIFVYGERCSAQVESIKRDIPGVEHLIYSGDNIPAGELHFETFTREGNSSEPLVSVGYEDPAYIIFTGGTTGFPKAALHTHHSSIFDVISVCLRTSMWDPDEVMITQIPMFHIGGLGLMREILTVGGKLVLVETFDALEILKLIDQEKATMIVLLPPATYIRLMDVPHIADFDTSTVTRVGGAAGVLPKALILRLFDTFPNANLHYGLGSTEAGNGGTLNIISRSMVESNSDLIGSIGRQAPFVEIRLVDEAGQEVPVGETGEAVLRGPMVMKEYFDQPKLNDQTLKDGWLHSGDLLKKDKDGYFYFVGRKKDMIKTGGENVFAPEVESVILSHPAVENCAVIGVPDPMFSETVMAVIKLRPDVKATDEDIIEHCKKYLSSYKKPRRVAFVDSFPISDAGKVQKFKLVEQYQKP